MTNINADVLAINSVRGDEYFTLEKDVRIIADNLIPDLNSAIVAAAKRWGGEVDGL